MESAVEKLTRTLSNIERSIESLAALHAQVAQLRNPIEHETVSQMVEESEQVTGVESEQITGIDAPNEPNNTERKSLRSWKCLQHKPTHNFIYRI